MQFYRYWTRTTAKANGPRGNIDFTAVGFSNESLQDALRVAEERAQQAAQTLASGQFFDRYYGTQQPLREEILEELQQDGKTIAVLSRNSYGAVVLNTPVVFFADIDLPSKPKRSGFLGLFGAPVDPATQLIDKIQELVDGDRSLGLRLYRTKKGYRVAIRSHQVPVQDSQSQRWLQHFGSDKLYVLLCRTQDCYRARLSPKPWRCGSAMPPQRFPFASSDAESDYRRWQNEYDNVVSQYATCAHISDFGSPHNDPVVEKILQIHDHFSLNGDQPLA